MISCLSYIESIEGLDYNLKLIFCKKYRTKWYMCGGVCFFTYNLFVCGCKSCSCSLTFDRRWPTQEAEHAAVKFNLRTRPPVKPPTHNHLQPPNTHCQLPKTLSTLSQNQPIVPRIFNNQPSGFSSDFFSPENQNLSEVLLTALIKLWFFCNRKSCGSRGGKEQRYSEPLGRT